MLLQNRRLKVAPALQFTATLVSELQQFQLKTISPRSDADIEWREWPHDELVLAVAIAAWNAEMDMPFYFGYI